MLCRSAEGEAVTAPPKAVEFMDVAPAQIVSVSTALIPFLEHDDANRALMGANMQRQAVPLLVRQAPLVGTGLEYRAAVDSGDVVIALHAGTVVDVDADKIIVEAKDGTRRLHADEVHALEPGHADPPQAGGAPRRQGEGGRGPRGRQLDRQRRARTRRQPARRVHAVRGLQLRGRDRAQRADRQGRHPLVDPHPRVRDRRSLDEARRRGDHPRHSEPLGGVARAARRARRRPHRCRGRLGRPARRQGHAEGRDRADGRGEADPRDLQGEGARGPRHVAQGPARRGRRRHRRQDVLARRRATT